MHGLKYYTNKSQNNIVSKMSECFSEEAQIDRVHRTCKLYKNESSGLTMKPGIIKFKAWR